MKFSISTSFYKRSHLVENLYNQIKAQTHTDWEWVVTDDFSEEKNAEEILKEICTKDSRVKYYQQSRKKECFYNPQRGCTGDIIIQFDSDDYAYPRTLELYNHYFLKHPEVMGISCLAQSVHENGSFVEISSGGMYDVGAHPTFNMTPMNRAWRNVITEFDDGKLNWFQNDTNIVRHVENRGKWLWLPRVLCDYFYSNDTFSRAPKTDQQNRDVENERLFIESKFPHLHDENKCSAYLQYYPILTMARAFSKGDFNKDIKRDKILYINKDLQPYSRLLLKELFFDHDLYFNSTDEPIQEIVIHLNPNTFNDLTSIMMELSTKYKGIKVNLYSNNKDNIDIDQVVPKLTELGYGFGWARSGHETFFNTAV